MLHMIMIMRTIRIKVQRILYLFATNIEVSHLYITPLIALKIRVVFNVTKLFAAKKNLFMIQLQDRTIRVICTI